MTKKEGLLISLVFIGWRLSLFALGWLAPFILSYQPSFPYAFTLLPQYVLPQWLYSWANFDGVHYLTIAERGYIGTGLIQAFFPVYPGMVAGLNVLLHNTLVSGLIISNLSAWFLVGIWFAFLKQSWGVRIAWKGVWILLVFPTAFFLGALYSESVFMSLVLMSFLMSGQRRWAWASLAALLASATRVVGVLLVPALLVELWLQETENHPQSRELSQLLPSILKTLKAKPREICMILASSLGLIAYMVFLYREYHDPLYFLHIQSEFGAGRQESLVLYPQVLWRYVKILATYQPFDWKYFTFIMELVAATLGLVSLLWSLKSIRLSYVLFAIGAFIVPTLTGTFSSLPRYLLVCFPVFIWLASTLESRRWLRWFYLLGSTVLLVINTILFIQGYWVA